MTVAVKMRKAWGAAGDWRYWLFFAQRRFTDPATRHRVARGLGRLLRPPRLQPPLDAQGRRDAQALDDEGVVVLGDLLSRDACARLRDYFVEKPVFDDYRPEVPPFLPLGEGRHPHSHVAFHATEDVLRAPGLLDLANDPRILSIVEEVLGFRPTISYLAAWWSYPTETGAQQAENFHRDVDDWAFLKLFVYLTDVDEDSGPHVYVRNSAADPRLTVLRRYEDEEVLGAYGNNQIVRHVAGAGTGILENTYGLHKGQQVRKGRRLMFQAVYSLFPIPYGVRRPVAALADVATGRVPLDPFVNRVYLSA